MGSVVITGTSTGIGWGTTKVLIERGFRVFGSVRKTSDAERLSKEFGDRFVPLLFDVTDEVAVSTAAADVRTRLAGERLAGLVNNAGVAGARPLLELSVAEFLRSISASSPRRRASTASSFSAPTQRLRRCRRSCDIATC